MATSIENKNHSKEILGKSIKLVGLIVTAGFGLFGIEKLAQFHLLEGLGLEISAATTYGLTQIAGNALKK